MQFAHKNYPKCAIPEKINKKIITANVKLPIKNRQLLNTCHAEPKNISSHAWHYKRTCDEPILPGVTS